MDMLAPGEEDEPMIDRSDPVARNRKADADQVVQRYQELRHLRRTGEEFGITRERVRQIVNSAGISTARIAKPKPEREERFCKQCGAPVYSNHARYCETHGTPQQRSWRRYQRMKADPERYAHWRELCNAAAKRRRARKREQSSR
jgi:ribosomal protein L37E